MLVVIALLAGSVVAHVAAPPAAAAAVAFTVTSGDDLPDADTTDGACAASTGDCTLRAALEQGDALNDDIDIAVPAGTYAVGTSGAEIVSGHRFTVHGAGEGLTVVDVSAGRWLDATAATIELRDLEVVGGGLTPIQLGSGALDLLRVTIRGGDGGAIKTEDAEVRIADSTFTDVSSSWGDSPLRILTAPSATITGSTFTGNSSEGGGGAVFLADTNAVIDGSTFDGNVAREGGALYTEDDPGLRGENVIEVRDSTFTANRAERAGGAVKNAGAALTLRATDLVGNGVDDCCGGGGALDNSGRARIEGSTLRDNFVAGAGLGAGGNEGGAIRHWGALEIDGSTIAGNWVVNGRGGAIHQSGTESTLAVAGSTISGNRSNTSGNIDVYDGPPLARSSGTALATTDTVPEVGGGGGAHIAEGRANVVNSTISGNEAVGEGQPGGGVFVAAAGRAQLIHVTVARNQADRGGGVSVTEAESVLVGSSIIAENAEANCAGPILSAGGNVEDDGSCDLQLPAGQPEDLVDVADAGLTDLGDHGGPTWTHGLYEGSPAHDVASVMSCTSMDTGGVDQRGEPRESTCDSGAFEGAIEEPGPPTDEPGPSTPPGPSDPPDDGTDPDDPGPDDPGPEEPGPDEPDPDETASLCGVAAAAGFDDVEGSNVHAAAIDCLVALGVAAGGPQGLSTDSFGPALPVTRGQVASFLERLVRRLGVELPAGPDAFDDDGSSVHHDAVNALAAAGVVDGHADGTFRAGDPVTRAQLASMLVRAHAFVSGATLPVGADAFDDDDGSTHEAAIDALAAAGIIYGTQVARTFDPHGHVRRDQAASFLVRLAEVLAAS